MDNGRYGVITEVGDLGLGFSEVSDKDQKILKEQEEKKKEEKE